MTDIFISYSHKDEAWKDALQDQLQVLQYHGDFAIWDDRQIQAGDSWYPAISEAIESARVAILLISADFLKSDFVRSEEIPRLLQRRSEDGLRIVPLVVRPCPWQTVPWLSSLQGGTKDNFPLSAHQPNSFELENELSRFVININGLLKASIQAEEAEQARLAAEKEAERVRIEAEKKEQARLDAEKEKQARIEAEEAEQARLAAEKEAERVRIEAEKKEQARLDAEKEEQSRIEAEEVEQARLAAEKEAERVRIEVEKKEQARLDAEKEEQARIEAEEAEQARLVAEKEAERVKIEAEKKEQARLDAEKEEQARIEEAEQARLATEKEAERVRIEAEKQEQARSRAKADERERVRIHAERRKKEHLDDEKEEQARVEVGEIERSKKTSKIEHPENNEPEVNKKQFPPLGLLAVGSAILLVVALLWYQSTVTRIEPEMVSIPAGTFTMGCIESRDNVEGGCHDWEKPAKKITLSAFKIGKYEITFDEWDACANEGGCRRPDDNGWGRGRRPVINVSRDDVQNYIQWLNQKTGKQYRLPSEAEWEYAARAGADSAFPWGNKISCSDANYSGCKNKTVEVNQFKPNTFGLYNTSGNVWEWVDDCWQDSHKGASKKGLSRQGCDKGAERVIRGGSWGSFGGSARSAFRDFYSPDLRFNGLGLRLSLVD